VLQNEAKKQQIALKTIQSGRKKVENAGEMATFTKQRTT